MTERGTRPGISKSRAGHLGLFGQIESGAEIRNLGMVDVNVTGSGDYIGVLAGYSRGDVLTSHVTGTISGGKRVGGFTGRSWGGIVARYSRTTVTANEYAGGLIQMVDGVGYASSDTARTQPYCDTYSSNASSQIECDRGRFTVRTRENEDMSDHPMVTVSWLGAARNGLASNVPGLDFTAASVYLLFLVVRS